AHGDRGLAAAVAMASMGAVAVPFAAARRTLMAAAEGGAADPRVKCVVVAPAGDDEPRRAVVGRLQELEALEAVLVVDRAGASGEAPGQLVARVGRDRDRVDLDDRHAGSSTRPPARCAAGAHSSSPRSANSRTAGTGSRSANSSPSSSEMPS